MWNSRILVLFVLGLTIFEDVFIWHLKTSFLFLVRFCKKLVEFHCL